MKEKQVLKEIYLLLKREKIKKNFSKLGIEGTLETIEKIQNPSLRELVKELHYKYLKGEY